MPALLFLGAPSWCQELVRNEEQAAARVQRFLEEVGIDDRVDLSSVSNRKGSPWGVENYRVETENKNSFTVNAVTGAVTGSQQSAEETRRKRKDTDVRHYRSDEEVWVAAERVLELAGLGYLGLKREEMKWYERRSDGLIDKFNKGTRVVAKFEARIEPYKGPVNDGNVMFDTVDGSLLAVRATTFWKFDPPKRVMPKAEALELLRDHFAFMRQFAVEQKIPGYAKYYAWPGDEEAAGHLSLGVTRGGMETARSNYGEQLAQKGLARLKWVYDTKHLAVSLDAETGEVTFDSPKATAPPDDIKTAQTSTAKADRRAGDRAEPVRPPASDKLPVQAGGLTALAVLALAGGLAVLKRRR
ncbi:MAG: hypothetical protein KF884_00060 [Fimbriimonadaceae bacterium]|nr:hypothetical protein [Fimbriimonadaceae bacterium]QYK58488.1 MAG: hypothetical protein KF884_00060 [Fimbriimonadaceae bacterium]